jgi:spore maturation protein CgeB
VFWNKEDPINYGMFIGTASLFDHVFTVDSDSVERYRRDLGHPRVHVLPFAAQPAIHYPPTSDEERTGTVAFAGSYYARKHAERRIQMEYVIDPAREFGLDIYDRMAGTEDARFTWPEKYRSHVAGSVAYPDMGDLYRRYRVFLNVNTVTDSPTMCARRIFELAATGTPVVSGPALAIDRMVPPGIVTVSENAAMTTESIEQLLDRGDMRAEASEVGPAWIADGNTYSDRADAIIAMIL